MTPSASVPFVHEMRVRYGECDMQGVVFNPNYLVYVGDAVDRWLVDRLGEEYQRSFDVMAKKVTLEWSSPARNGDVLGLLVSVSRWGNTSFDVTVRGVCGERPVFEAVLVYVSVTPGGHTAAPVPEWVRAGLSA